MKRPTPALLREVFVLAMPFVLYLAHALYFGAWIIDDAGISYAYARSLAQGYGLVSQPGMPPVEGFTNFSWVLLLTPFFWLRLFDPIITPKVIGMILTGLTFWLAARTLQQVAGHPRLATFVVLSLLAMNTSFVLWSVSGLENPLFALVTAALLHRLTRAAGGTPPTQTSAVQLGGLSFLVALTRPDGVLFFAAYPAWLAWEALCGALDRRTALRHAFVYTAVFVALCGTLTAFRWFYFGDVVPNTFHVKGGGTLASLAHLLLLTPDAFQRVFELFYSVLSYFGGFLFAGMFICVTALLALKKFPSALRPALLMTVLAMALYALMPVDWMGEVRFSTPFYAPFLVLAFGLGEATLRLFHLAAANRNRLVFVVLTLVLLTSAAGGWVRSVQYMSQADSNQGMQINFEYITNEYALRFNRYAKTLGVEDGSILLPDLGGTLYYSDLRVYDLVGLIDRTIARTRLVNQPAFYDYIFETLKPTFIHTHSAWAYQARFDDDPRFRRDYLPIRESIDTDVLEEYGDALYSGDYVRREVAENNPTAFEQLRAEP